MLAGWVSAAPARINFGVLATMLPSLGLPAAVVAPTATPSPEAAAVAVAPTPVPPTPTTAPTATPPPEPTATFTPEPSPTAAVADLVTGVVNSVAGVNARSEPATTGVVVRLLNQGERMAVVNEQEGWLQVILTDSTVAWVAAEFLDRSVQSVPLAQVNVLRAVANLPPLSGSVPITGGAPITENATITGAASITSTLLAAAAAAASTSPAPVPPVTFDVTVLGDPGINARSLPSTDGVIVAAVPLSSTLTAVGKSADGLWLAVQLADGQAGWVLAQFVDPAGDVAALSVLDPAALAATTAVTDTVTPVTPPPDEGVATEATPVAAPAPGGVTLAGTVSNALGTNLRAAPDRNLDPIVSANADAALTAVGRTADAAWLQVQLADGTLGWVLAGTVAVEGDVTTLPVLP